MVSWHPANEDQRRLVVANLVDETSGCWDVPRIINLLVYQQCMNIIVNTKPPIQGSGQDTLIFTPSGIGKGDPNCATCGEYEDDIMHFSFHCAFSRSC